MFTRPKKQVLKDESHSNASEREEQDAEEDNDQVEELPEKKNERENSRNVSVHS